MKRCKVMLALIGTIIIAFLSHQGAYATVIPYVDTGFTFQSPDSDVDFVIVRENYDPVTYEHALYFRAFDGTIDWDGAGGTISFSPGISIVDVFYLRDASWDNSQLTNSDSPWGISTGNYSDTYRGLEPWDQVGPDSISWNNQSVSFDANFRSGMDDFRVVVDYGDSFPFGAFCDISLSTGSNTEGFPYVTGIQVGNVDGLVPGSGDFGEVTNLRVPLTPIPEPSTMLLLGSGLIGLVGFRRKFRKVGQSHIEVR